MSEWEDDILRAPATSAADCADARLRSSASKESVAMSEAERQSMTLICRRDPARRMARFYALSLQADLLTGWSLVREWGRIGRAGQVRVDPHRELAVAEIAAQQLEASKRRRGYA